MGRTTFPSASTSTQSSFDGRATTRLAPLLPEESVTSPENAVNSARRAAWPLP